MSGDEPPNWKPPNDSSRLPQTASETIDYLKTMVLHRLNQEVIQQQLFYHTADHVRAVQRRAEQIFAVVASALPTSDQLHLKRLLDLCAVAHDLVQQFEPSVQIHAARQRRSGTSEMATIDQLIDYIEQLNCQLDQSSRHHPAKLTDDDIQVIHQAIKATICTYDVQEQAIYQPLLYSGEPLSVVSRILALADLGTLSMDGIEAYNREGSLLFLEENPDVVALLRQGTLDSIATTDPILAENIRQRLLKRCRFQVSFAKSRLARTPQELQGFPAETISTLMTQTFRYLSSATVQTVEAITPTAAETSLKALLQFFQFERYLSF